MVHVKLLAAVGAATASVTVALQQVVAATAPASPAASFIGSAEQVLIMAGVSVGITYMALKGKGEQNARDIASTDANVVNLTGKIEAQSEMLTKVRIDIATLLTNSENIGNKAASQLDGIHSVVDGRLTIALDRLGAMEGEMRSLRAQLDITKS